MKYYPAIFIILLLASTLPSPGSGRDLVDLKPHLELTGYYDDNVDFSPQSSSSDISLQMSPGIAARLNLRRMPIEADYTYTRYQYLKRSDLTRDFHDAYIRTTIPFAKTFFLRIHDRYNTVPLDVNQPVDQPSNLTQKNSFSVMPFWEKQLNSKNKLKAGYEYDRVDYTSSGLTGDDYNGHRFFIRWDGDLDRALVIYQKDQYRMKYFSVAPDYTQFLPEAGITGRLSRRLKFNISGGYSFDETGGERDTGYVYAIEGDWFPTSKIDLAAIFRRERTTDIEGEPYTEQYYQLELKYRPTKRIALLSHIRYYDNNYQDADNRRINFKLGATYRLNKWILIKGGYIRIENVDMPAAESAEANRAYLGVDIVI